MSEKLSKRLADADSEEEVIKILEIYKDYILLEEITTFIAGYQERPVRSMDEVLEFIRFLIDEEEESDDRINTLFNVLKIGESHSIANDNFIDEEGLNEQEIWIKRASEYYDK